MSRDRDTQSKINPSSTVVDERAFLLSQKRTFARLLADVEARLLALSQPVSGPDTSDESAPARGY
jgi:hypothetical protein